VGPEHVDKRDRPAAHRRDVAEIDHDRAIAGEPGIRRHKTFDHAFGGEQQKPSARIGQRGGVVADGDVAVAAEARRVVFQDGHFFGHGRKGVQPGGEGGETRCRVHATCSAAG
jgi:hypothetical protein